MNTDGPAPERSILGAFLHRGGLWVLAQAVLMAAVVVLALLFQRTLPPALPRLWGAALLALGALCGLAGAIALGSGLTPLPRPGQQSRLVRHGIYGLMRHPLYTSVLLAALGWALIWGSGPALLAALALAPFFEAKARREERWLRERFPEYADYARRVRRFIPWVY